jgi:hypothetical protein
LLEKERLESIAENAIAAGAPDANAAILATDEASFRCFTGYGYSNGSTDREGAGQQ